MLHCRVPMAPYTSMASRKSIQKKLPFTLLADVTPFSTSITQKLFFFWLSGVYAGICFLGGTIPSRVYSFNKPFVKTLMTELNVTAVASKDAGVNLKRWEDLSSQIAWFIEEDWLLYVVSS